MFDINFVYKGDMFNYKFTTIWPIDAYFLIKKFGASRHQNLDTVESSNMMVIEVRVYYTYSTPTLY